MTGYARWLRDPAFAVYLLALVLIPWRWLSPLGSVNERSGAADIVIALALVLWLYTRACAIARSRPNGASIALVAFGGCATASAIFAVSGTDALPHLLVIYELIALMVLTWDYARRPDRLATIGWAMAANIVAIAVAVAVGLVLFYAGVSSGLTDNYGALSPSTSYARIRAGFYSGPLLGSFAIVAWATVTACRANFRPRVLLGLQVTTVLIAVASLSRPLLGLLVAIGVLYFWQRRRTAAIAVFVVGLATVAALGVGQLHVDPSRPWNASYDLDSSTRRHEAVVALKKIPHRPVTGLGPGALPGELRGHARQAHVTPIDVAATLGVPALAALVWMIVVLWRRRAPGSQAVWAGLAGLAVDGLGQDIEHFRHVWLLLGLAAAATAMAVIGDDDA